MKRLRLEVESRSIAAEAADYTATDSCIDDLADEDWFVGLDYSFRPVATVGMSVLEARNGLVSRHRDLQARS